VSRVDDGRVWQREQLLVERVVQGAAQFRGIHANGSHEVRRATDIADEQGVSCEHSGRFLRFCTFVHKQADSLGGVAGGG